MGAYDNPKVPIVDYTQFTKNFMQGWQFWSQMWEQKRKQQQLAQKQAEQNELKRLQGTFVKPDKELGTLYTDAMTSIFRGVVDKNTWAGWDAGTRQRVVQDMQTEAAGAKSLRMALEFDLSKIDKGTNPDLYHFVVAAQSLTDGNPSNFKLQPGRYNGGTKDRSDSSKFIFTPGEVGLSYSYTRKSDKKTIYYNADELHSVLENVRDAHADLKKEYDEDVIPSIAKNINKEGGDFNRKWHEYTTEQREEFINNGKATSATGFNYEAGVDAKIDKWLNNSINYDIAAGIYRNFIPGAESHIYKPTKGQLEEMIADQGEYLLKSGKGKAYADYQNWVKTQIDMNDDGEISDAEVANLHAEQEKILAEKLRRDIWNTQAIRETPIKQPEVDEIEEIEEIEEFEGVEVNKAGGGVIRVADAKSSELNYARKQMKLIQKEFDAVSKRKAGVDDLNNNKDYFTSSPQYNDVFTAYRDDEDSPGLPDYWLNKASQQQTFIINDVKNIAAKKPKERSSFENKVYKLYEDSVSSYDPGINKIVSQSSNLRALGYGRSQVDPITKQLVLFKTNPKKDEGPLQLDLNNKDDVATLYEMMVGEGKTGAGKEIYSDLFDALYSNEYFKQ